MTKKSNQVTNVMGPYGPTMQTKTTIGVNNARISNGRPSTLNASLAIANVAQVLSEESFQIGRHAFAEPVSTALAPVNFIPGVPTKEASYVTTMRRPHCIASQITMRGKISNGKTRYEMDIPYYDAEALLVLNDSSASPGAVAPSGSFKVAVEVLGGGVMTGTDAGAMLKLDKLLYAALNDVFLAATAGSGTETKFSAAGYGIQPAVSS